MSAQTKRCTKCGEILPRTPEYFYRQSESPDGLRPQCKACYRTWREEHYKRPGVLERKHEQDREYRNRPEERARRREYAKQYRAENRERIQEVEKQYRIENREKGRERGRKWRALPGARERATAKQRRWRAENRDRELELARERHKKNPEKNTARMQRYLAKKAQNGGSFTGEEWLALCEAYDNRCLWCGESKPLTADHIVPVSEGGSSDIGNIQPLCRSCNSRKGTQSIDFRIAHDILHGCDEPVARAWA